MIFVFDLDGTICFKGKPLEQEVCDALDFCISKGHEVVFASARPIRDLLPVLPEKYHSFRMVGGNGSFVYCDEKITYEAFSKEVEEKLKDLINRHQLTYLIDSDWDYSFTGEVTHPIFVNIDPKRKAVNRKLHELQGISKAVIFTNEEVVKQELIDLKVSVFEHQAERLLDISPTGIHKAIGLQKLGIETFIAFGNDQNDLSLFQHAAFSVCVGMHPVSVYANGVIESEHVAEKIRELALHFASMEQKDKNYVPVG